MKGSGYAPKYSKRLKHVLYIAAVKKRGYDEVEGRGFKRRMTPSFGTWRRCFVACSASTSSFQPWIFTTKWSRISIQKRIRLFHPHAMQIYATGISQQKTPSKS